jgi:hypothetical protein
MIEKDIAEKIKAVARLEDVIGDLRKSGKEFYTKCPKCGKIDPKKKKGLMVDTSKQIYKCFSCDWGGNSAVSFLMETENLKYPEALAKLAEIHNIDIESADDRQKRLNHEKEMKRQARKDKRIENFCDRQLAESGLEYGDLEVEYSEDGGVTQKKRPTFLSGTRDQYGNYVVGTGDDMLIYYHDLEGKQVMFKAPKATKMQPLIRVRWQNPELHKDKEGHPIKYQSPAGSGSHIYIPQKIREHYKYAKPIDILFIQEGEKKAEKSCKHDILSIGIMGIQNIGGSGTLPPEIQLIVQRCQVKEVCFILDSDWSNLSGNLKNGDAVDQRPRSFFYAVKNYKEYMNTLVNLGISVEIWFGYVKPNEAGAKGIDDLLVQVLPGNEKKLADDIAFAKHDKQGAGELVQLHKITTSNDKQLADLWTLNDPQEFARIHAAELEGLAEFQIGKFRRRFNADGVLEMVDKLMPTEQYWEESTHETRSGDLRKELSFNYYNCFNFLQNRGFWRIKMKSGIFDFIHIRNRVVHKVDNYAIKDFVTEFTEEIKEIAVLNMIYRGGPQYLGHEKLSNLKFYWPTIEKAGRDSQCLFFKDKIWEITAEGIVEKTYSEFKNFVWEDKIINAEVSALPPLVKVVQMNDELRKQVKDEYKSVQNGEFFIDITDEGRRCHFLQFLKNTSDFTFRKKRKFEQTNNPEDLPDFEEILMDTRHLVNKLTAMGYLLHDYKNDSELKAVICMDGKISEVGASNGRTGKSIFGRAVEQVIPQTYIPAKNKRITEDNFLYGDVTEKTKNIFLDDVRANIDFEFFFPVISGKLKVNPKGGQPFTLEQQDTPKLLLTTNHAINGEGSSFKDRQAFVAFSDFYNETHKPIDDFGVNFFTEWEQEQWNLFFNLMATCLQLYFQSLRDCWAGKNKGIVEPPMETLEKRRLRQQIGEDFMQWAETAFAMNTEGEAIDGSSHINERISRHELFNEFMEEYPHARKYINPTSFKKRMLFYCKYKGLHFNIAKLNKEGIDFSTFKKHNPGEMFEGDDDKSGGKEYFTISAVVF